MPLYRIRFFFDWGCTLFWSGNSEARERFGYAIEPEALPLSCATIEEAYRLSAWHDRSVDQHHPMNPGPWRQEECDRFNAAVRELFERAHAELGEDFELVTEQREYHEDPDLDEYLENPNSFPRYDQWIR